jgi:hypothetical protein
MVAQLEHQFRLGKLSSQGLWFFCQVLCVCVDACVICLGTVFHCSFHCSSNVLHQKMKSTRILFKKR